MDFQSIALPTELPGRTRKRDRGIAPANTLSNGNPAKDLYFSERLIEIAKEIVDIFDAYAQPHERIFNS